MPLYYNETQLLAHKQKAPARRGEGPRKLLAAPAVIRLSRA